MTKIAVIDFETTGLSWKTDYPTEIGIKYMDEDGALEYSSLIQLPEGVEVPPFITELTGLTTEKLQAEGKPLEVVKREVYKFLTQYGHTDDVIFVGHNINFDLGFLFAYFGITPVQYFCTRSVEILTNPHENASLKNVYARYFGEKEQSHRSMDDIEMTEKLFIRQFNTHGVAAMMSYFKNRLVNMPDRELSFKPAYAKVLDFSAKYVSERIHGEALELIKKQQDSLNILEERVDWLDCLEAAGVDNWSGYSEARAIQRGEEI